MQKRPPVAAGNRIDVPVELFASPAVKGSLAAQVSRGAELVGMSTLIGDQDDFHVWRHRRNNWVRTAAMALASETDLPDLVERFRAAAIVNRPLVDWRQALPVEVQAVDAATDMLRRLLGAS